MEYTYAAPDSRVTKVTTQYPKAIWELFVTSIK
jgi:hypothetical protein